MGETLKKPGEKKQQQKIDKELDEGLKETFPTSDPVAVTQPGGGEDPALLRKNREERKTH